ncbi:MAG: hypothetical protein ACFFCI_01610 [Promethearchaeota archaeon]
MNKSIKSWFVKIFTKDVDLERNSFLYLFFSFLAIVLIVEYYILKFFLFMNYGMDKEMPLVLILLMLSLDFLLSGFLIDQIKNKTRFYNLNLLICVVGLFLSSIQYFVIRIIGFLVLLITIPQLIIIWSSILVHETNILNRGRVTAILLISCFLLSLIGFIFIFFRDLFIYLIFIEGILLIVIFWFSRAYKYIETEERLRSEGKFLKIIFEKHFSRYSVAFAFLSGLLGGLFYDSLEYFYRTYNSGYNIDIIIFSVVSFFYIIAAGWFFDNIGRKSTLVIGILVVSFFYISHGSFYDSSIALIFGIPIRIHITLHYAFAFLPLILAIMTISGDFSTERGNLKYRGRINSLFLALMCLGIALGYFFYRLIDVNEDLINNWVPNLPNLLNSFVIVMILVWIMAGKDILVSKESQWAKSLKHLFVLTISGVCLYNYDFIYKYHKIKDKKKRLDEDVISGALSGIIAILSEITQSKKHIEKIEKEGNYFYFSFGKSHIVALIATMNLPVLSKKLDAFSKDFEQRFFSEIQSFEGEIDKFDSAKYLINRYFSQKYAHFLK